MSGDGETFNLDRILNGLQSSEKSVKKNAIKDFNKVIQTNGSNLVELYEKTWKVLLSCFQDRLEICREGSVLIMSHLTTLLEPEDLHLTSVVPAIRRRFGVEKVVEESEEVRLLLVKLLYTLITKCGKLLDPYVEDIVEILARGVSDTAPLVKRESCTCIIEVSKSLKCEFYNYSKSLIKPLTDSILHQHWRVRVSIIEALGCTVLYGDSKSVPDAVGPLARRYFDDNYNVRLATTKVVGTWLIELPDRYSYFPHLLPLILTSLTDENEEVATEGQRLWDMAGKQYLLENENDFKDRSDFLPEKLEHYPPGVRRPNLGCRGLVEREACKFLIAVGKELTDWVLSVRLKSALLLGQLILHAEDKATQQIQKILPPIYKAAVDQETPVAHYTLRAAEYLGYFVPTDVLVRLVVEQAVIGSPGEVRSLAAMVRGMRATDLSPHLASIAPLLFHPSFKEDEQMSQLTLVKSLMDNCGEKCLEIGNEIWASIVSNSGLATSEKVTVYGSDLLKEFLVLGGGSKQEVHRNYSNFLFDKIVHKNVWTSHCHEQFMFSAIIDMAGEAIGGHIDEVLTILRVALGPESDPEAALKIVMATSSLLEKREVTLPDSLTLIFSQTLIKEILNPVLTWKAGRSAEALRTAGTALLLTSFKAYYSAFPSEGGWGDGECEGTMAQDMSPLLLSLAEDSSHITRSLALRILAIGAPQLATMPPQEFSKIVQVVLKRLDDCDKEVRQRSVNSLTLLYKEHFKVIAPDFINNSLLEFTFNTLLIHLDDQEPSFQNIILDCLKAVGLGNRKLLRSRIFKENFRDKEICEKLLTYLEEL